MLPHVYFVYQSCIAGLEIYAEHDRSFMLQVIAIWIHLYSPPHHRKWGTLRFKMKVSGVCQNGEVVVRKSSIKKGVLKNFAKFTRKHLYQNHFLNKVAGLGLQLYWKRDLWQRCFPVNFAKFLRTPFFIEHLWLLLLKVNGRILLKWKKTTSGDIMVIEINNGGILINKRKW